MFGTTAPTDFNDNAPVKQVIKALLSIQFLMGHHRDRPGVPRTRSPSLLPLSLIRETTSAL
ncbi:MAG TPA: hypothetical protein VF553_14165 [Pyrinomonadaceae bacterium]